MLAVATANTAEVITFIGAVAVVALVWINAKYGSGPRHKA